VGNLLTMKRILYITYDGLCDPLGQSQVVPYILSLSDKNIQWTILSYEKEEKENSITEIVNKKLKSADVKWICLTYHNRYSLFSKFFDLSMGVYKVLRSQDKYDIIHSRGFLGATLGVFLKRLLGAQFVFDMRGFWAEERADIGSWKRNQFGYKVANWLERKFIHSADAIVVLTQSAKKILSCEYQYPDHEKVFVIPTCVDTHKFSKPDVIPAKAGIQNLSFCFSGSLGTWYCLDEMFNFYRQARSQYSDSVFQLLVNWTSWVRLSEDEKKRIKAIDGVQLKCSSYEDLPHHLSRNNIGLCFINPFPSRRASFPTKLGEFLSMGMPVIMNKGIGDCDEWIEKEGLGIIVDDFSDSSYNEAVSKIVTLIEDKNISERCRDFAERFVSLEYGVSKYKEVFNYLT